MHVQLTDALTCPKCGPEWPLILLADRVHDRRILAGTLGCPNCRTQFRVQDGFADLSETETQRGAETQMGNQGEASAEYAMRLAALLGVTEGPALVLVVGSGAVSAADISALVPDIEVVGAWPALAAEEESAGVTRLGIGAVLPMRNASMRAIALTDEASEALIEEAARVVVPRGRVVVLSGERATAERLERAGLRVMARDEHATVALRAAI